MSADGGLAAFWFNSFASCVSPDADKLCVPAGLSALSALSLLLSSLLLLCQRCKAPGDPSGETAIVVYSFLGNLCSTVGAFLSRQLQIQIFMSAFAALMDAVYIIFCCLPMILCFHTKTQKRQRMLKKRRRQYLLAVGVLMVVAGGFLKSRPDETPVIRPVSGKKLLYANMQTSSWSPLMVRMHRAAF